MNNFRRLLLPGILALVLGATLVGCDASAGRPSHATLLSRSERINGAVAAARRFLSDRQAADGAWRSEVYGAFKDGPSLTPLVLEALLTPASQSGEPACRKGLAYLANMVRRPDGSIDAGAHGLSFPIYTAALAVQLLSGPDQANFGRARDAWLTYLRQRQLTEELGWQPTDRAYGGWGYCNGVPRKPGPAGAVLPLTESNLSATVFALKALRAANCADARVFRKALVFVERCQNYREEPDPAFDDGGFFFIYDDPVRNKAGSAGKDKAERERFFSYGSATADGLQALRACGLPLDHPRVVAARRWLEKHFQAAAHPMKNNLRRTSLGGKWYYYYAASVAQALEATRVKEVAGPAVPVLWAEALADAILQLQRPDGSWRSSSLLDNPDREDDPVVATSLAVIALTACQPQSPNSRFAGASEDARSW